MKRFLVYCASTPQTDISSVFSGDVKAILGTAGYQDDCLQHMNRSGLVQGGVDKLILRNAARGIVPDDIIDRPKAGFGALCVFR